MTKLEMIEGCEFTLVRDGAFDVITIRTPTKGNDPVALRGNAARMRFSDYILACADGLLAGVVARNLCWEKAQELAEKMRDEYRRLSVLKGLVRSGEAREEAVQHANAMDRLLLKARRMRESLEKSASSSDGDVHSPRETPGGGADT